MTTDISDDPTPPLPMADADRRSFLKKMAAIIAGGVATLVPGVAGLLTFLDPLRRKAAAAEYIPVAPLDAIPPDGTLRKFTILADKTDAWNKYVNAPVGAVYLRRDGEKLTCFNVVCPHAGCFVDALPGGGFACPCHDSEFNPDGSIKPITRAGGRTVSPRGMDSLEVDAEALKQGQVRVRFQNFLAGVHEKIPR